VRNPPIGIAILGFIALMAGFAYLILGLRWMGAIVFGPVPSGEGVGLTGLLAIVAGVIYVAAGVALWSLRAWAWAFAMILSVFGLFEAVLVAFAADSLAAGFGAALLPAVVLWYLNTDQIKAEFMEANPPEPEAAPAAPAPAAAAPAPAEPPAPAAPPPAAPPPPPAAEGS
jgi:hypothetical protein